MLKITEFSLLCIFIIVKVWSLLWPGGYQWTIYCHKMRDQLLTTFILLVVMLLKQPNGETVDPIDWPLPPTLHRAVPYRLHVLHGVNVGHKTQDLMQQPRRERIKNWAQGINRCGGILEQELEQLELMINSNIIY